MDCRLEKYRAKRGWTQAELAQRAQVSVETIADLEDGKACLTTSEELLKLAATLDVTLEALFF